MSDRFRNHSLPAPHGERGTPGRHRVAPQKSAALLPRKIGEIGDCPYFGARFFLAHCLSPSPSASESFISCPAVPATDAA